jgi:hypothetical protein
MAGERKKVVARRPKPVLSLGHRCSIEPGPHRTEVLELTLPLRLPSLIKHASTMTWNTP